MWSAAAGACLSSPTHWYMTHSHTADFSHTHVVDASKHVIVTGEGLDEAHLPHCFF